MSPRWRGKELKLVREVERYRLEIVGLTSTHSLGSGTQLLERGWTLHYSSLELPRFEVVVDARSLEPVVAATPNPVVDTGSKGYAVRLKKESYRTMLACGTPDAVGQVPSRPSKPQPGRSWRQKLRVWEEFGEAMEEDYRAGGELLLTSTGDIVGRWKKYFEDLLNPTTNLPSSEEAEAGDSEVDSSITRAEVTEYCMEVGELLTSTGDIVGRWKKYFEDLLNPTDLPSSEEAEAGDSEVDSSITRAEVTEVVLKFHRWQWQGAGGG
ncbi:hypothetical protein L3Q82_003464 [Scortum barcoo]|uniref:Uncharacterized protein n=1 Tax=Scortum barcoo TaxID=214431 RepID=A0ACB8VMR1_9TELE|nr:hypothetical protein L3Q82_003464 [Scortum barcoo]